MVPHTGQSTFQANQDLRAYVEVLGALAADGLWLHTCSSFSAHSSVWCLHSDGCLLLSAEPFAAGAGAWASTIRSARHGWCLCCLCCVEHSNGRSCSCAGVAAAAFAVVS